MSARRSARAFVERRLALAHRTGEAGFVLIIALAVTLVSMVLITALLTLTVDSQQLEESGRVRERQVRAAEGGLDVAINKVRNNQIVAAPIPWQPGLPIPANETGRIGDCDDLLPEVMGIDGEQVRVSCVNQGAPPTVATPANAAANNDPWIPADNGGPSLRLVGAPYSGTWVDKTTFPWSNARALGAQYNAGTIAGSKASIVHTGAAPLRVVGGVEAKHQIVALRNPVTAKTQGPGADAELWPFGSALEVTGYARQGGSGLFTNSTGGTGCGIAATDNVWGTQASMVEADGDPALQLSDPSDIDSDIVFVNELVCDDENLAGAAGGALPAGSGEWTYRDTQITKQVLPSSCTAATNATPGWRTKVNGVVRLRAGSYDAAATAILNNWFSGGCQNTTFWFEPGDYWFDVAAPGSSALLFNDHTSDWVFGAPNLSVGVWANGPSGTNFENAPGGRPVKAAFPRVCDADQQGANITLSSRTGLQHSAGRVAICGPRPPLTTPPNNNAPRGAPVHTTAIFQRTSVPLGNRLTPTTPNVASGWTLPSGGDLAANLKNRDGVVARTSVDVPDPFWYFLGIPIPDRSTCWDSYLLFGGGGCGPWERSIPLGDFANVDRPDPGPGPIDNAFIDLTANAYFSDRVDSNSARRSKIRFDVTLSNGSTCNVQRDNLPTNFVTRSYDLFGPGSTCGAVLTDRSQLNGADITLRVWMNNPSLDFQDINQLFFDIDQLQLRTSWSPKVTSVSTESAAGVTPFENPSRALQKGNGDGGVATVRNSCTNTILFGIFCSGVEWYESAINFQGFADDALLDGFLPLDSVQLSIYMRSVNALWSTGPPDTRLVVSITTASGATCTRDLPRSALAVNVGQGTGNFLTTPLQFDLVTGIATGSCGTVLKTPADLIGANMRLLLRASNECYLACQFGWDVDGVTLQATSIGYDKPPSSFRVRWSPYVTGQNGNPGEPGDASFNVVGSTSIVTNDVEVDWDGGGRPLGQPIFVGGNNRPGLVAGSLASRATTGSWPAANAFPPQRLPDPISSNGATRPPIRRILLTSCVIENPGAPENQQRLVRRAAAEVDVRDAVGGGIMVPGNEVTVRRWSVNMPASSSAAAAGCPPFSDF